MGSEIDDSDDDIDDIDDIDNIDGNLPPRALMPVLTTEGGVRIPILDLLKIDPASLVFEYRVHSPWQASIGYLTAKQVATVERLKREVKATEARLYIEHRTRLTAAGSRAPGVELLKAYVTTDPRMADAEMRLIDAEEILGGWKAAQAAMLSRKECLISMGAEVRIDRKAQSSTI